MLFLIPVSRSDLHLFQPLVSVLVHFGGLQNHEILVVPTQEVEGEATQIAAPLHDLCRTRVIGLGETPTFGWPAACNRTFVGAVDILLNTGYEGAFFWLECDVTPLVPGWADAWQGEYFRSGKRCMGYVRPSAEISPSYEGSHLIGAGTMHTSIFREHIWWRSVANNQNEPFDIILRHLIAPLSHNTALYHHAYTSHDFTRSATGYHYKAAVLNEARQKAYDREGVIPQSAVVCHGCKDGSLAHLILDGNKVREYIESIIDADENERLKDAKSVRTQFVFDGLQTPGFSQIADPEAVRQSLGEPTAKMSASREFQFLSKAIESWTIEIPSAYKGLSPGTPSHAAVLMKALEESRKPDESAPITTADRDNASRIASIVNANPTGKSMKRGPILDELNLSLAELISAARVPNAGFELSPGPALYIKPLRPKSLQPREISAVEV